MLTKTRLIEDSRSNLSGGALPLQRMETILNGQEMSCFSTSVARFFRERKLNQTFLKDQEDDLMKIRKSNDMIGLSPNIYQCEEPRARNLSSSISEVANRNIPNKWD